MISLDAASVLLQWASGGLLFLWVTTRRREVSLGYGWLMRGTYALMAAGAAYLKAPFVTPFADTDTRLAPFRHLDGAVTTVPMMRNADLGDARYGRGEGWMAVDLPYLGRSLWLTVIVGTYIIFPPYRATPTPGATDLSQYPRALVLANPNTAWLHAFAMEIKEHMPWIAAMLSTAVAFTAVRYPEAVVRDRSLRRMALMLLAIAFVLVAGTSLLGVFVNKAAPLA